MFNEVKKTVEGIISAAEVLERPSLSTLAKYRSNIKYFFDRVGVESVQDLTIEHFQEFILKTRKRGAGNSFIANVISAVRWMLTKYEAKYGKLEHLRISEIERPTIYHKQQSFLTVEELYRLIEAVKSDSSQGPSIRKERFLALVLILVRTGARIAEILSIEKDKIDWGKMEVVIVGKGKKPRTLYLTPEVIEQLRKYLSLRTDSHPSLFVALNGKSTWAQTDINRTFVRYVRRSGLEKHVTNHTLRRTFATLHVENGTPINVLQRLMGHSSPQITLKSYVDVASEKKAKAAVTDDYFKFIPENKLKKDSESPFTQSN